MGKHDQTAATLLATVEARTKQIAGLTDEIRSKDGEIKRLAERCASQDRNIDQIRQWLVAEQEKVTKLNAIIATLDPRQVENTIERRLSTARSIIRGRNLEIKQLNERLHRCLGWIDHASSQHPTLNQPPKPEGGAMTGFSGARDEMDEEIPF